MEGSDYVESISCEVDNFLDDFSGIEDGIEACEKQLFGYNFAVRVYPRGCDDMSSDYIGVKLQNKSKVPVKMAYSIAVCNFKGNDHCWGEIKGKKPGELTFLIGDQVWTDPEIVTFQSYGNDDDTWG
jgi:hypothetical protein